MPKRETDVVAGEQGLSMHWDHVQGFPFFTPGYVPTTELALYGPGPDGARALESVLARQMEPPQFPVPLSTMRSRMTFGSALHGRAVEVGPFKVTPFEVPHPQGCLGYRVEADGHVFVYGLRVSVGGHIRPPCGSLPPGFELPPLPSMLDFSR